MQKHLTEIIIGSVTAVVAFTGGWLGKSLALKRAAKKAAVQEEPPAEEDKEAA